MKKGSPEGHSVRNEACCRSFGGEWNGGHGLLLFWRVKDRMQLERRMRNPLLTSC